MLSVSAIISLTLYAVQYNLWSDNEIVKPPATAPDVRLCHSLDARLTLDPESFFNAFSRLFSRPSWSTSAVQHINLGWFSNMIVI